jgi:hypothetical protein
MKLKHPWLWLAGTLAVILLSAAAVFFYQFNEALRGDYATARVIQTVEDYVKTHDGSWPTSWEDLDGTETAHATRLDSSYWRRYTHVDFTLTSEQLVEKPDLIYDAVKPLSGEYIVYPHARQNLEGVMQAIRDARKSPTPSGR